MRKPKFNIDQITSVTTVADQFDALQKKAKKHPQFISDNNKIEFVLVDYQQFESMYNESEALKEYVHEMKDTNRINKTGMMAEEFAKYLVKANRQNDRELTG